MWKKLLVISVATAGLALAAAVNADARGMGGRGGADVGFEGRVGHADFNARAESREPGFRPRGWNEGRKTGWHCRISSHRCIPPGLR